MAIVPRLLVSRTLRYKIKDIPEEGELVNETLNPSQLSEALSGTDVDCTRSSAAVNLQLSVTSDEVLVRGQVKATLLVPCASCLAPAQVAVDVPVQLLYRRADAESAEEAASDDDPQSELDFAEHDGRVVDLEPMVREQLILSLPISPRCREACLGLCPECGQDRNLSDCGHSQKTAKVLAFIDLNKLKLQ